MPEARIVRDPAVLCGKPVVAGTRISVELILEKLAAGQSADRIQRAYPHLPSDAVSAALAFAAAAVRDEPNVPLGRQSA